jgi:Ras-related protein Rab-24
VLFLCGTKVDLLTEDFPRGISTDVVEDYASELDVKTFETSSKTGENVEALFRAVAESIDSPMHETRGWLL